MSKELQLGKIIETGREASRDAVHVAVAPVYAGTPLVPGQPIRLNGDGKAEGASWRAAVGVVDPFLQDAVGVNQRFWAWLKPGSIKTLRHHWTHPAFPDQDPGDSSIPPEVWAPIDAWLAGNYNRMDREPFLDALDCFVRGERYATSGFQLLNDHVPDECWDAYEKIRNVHVPVSIREDAHFSCSC